MYSLFTTTLLLLQGYLFYSATIESYYSASNSKQGTTFCSTHKHFIVFSQSIIALFSLQTMSYYGNDWWQEGSIMVVVWVPVVPTPIGWTNSSFTFRSHQSFCFPPNRINLEIWFHNIIKEFASNGNHTFVRGVCVCVCV